MSKRLENLIDDYWDAAYQEGKDGRTTDIGGRAQKIRYDIDDEIAKLQQPRPAEGSEPVAWMRPEGDAICTASQKEYCEKTGEGPRASHNSTWNINGFTVPLFQHQPRSAVPDEIIKAGNALSFAAHTGGGTAGADEHLKQCIADWENALSAAQQPDGDT